MIHPKFGFEMKTFWETFEGQYQPGHQKHRDYLLDLLKGQEVKSIFDVGCGTGPIYQIIKEDSNRWPFAYKGTDYSRAMIAVCKEDYPEGNWEVQDARHLTEADNSWDCVLLMHSLDHLDDYQSAIKESARVAKKYVCIVLWRPIMEGDRNNLNSVNMYGKKDGEAPWEDTYLQEYSRSNLEKAFEEAGLKIVHTVEGEDINDRGNGCNYLFLLEKKI